MIRFGTAGIPLSCNGNTSDGIKCCADMGLKAMEIEFVRSVYLKKQPAIEAGETAKKYNIKLSAHAPYFINACSPEKIKIDKSLGYILTSARALSYAGGGVVVFHPGYYMGKPTQLCTEQVIDLMQRIYNKIDSSIVLGPELMGKATQFGSLEEIVMLAQHFGLKRCCPVVDWGHLNSRTNGSLKSKNAYSKILEYVENNLGSGAFKNFHSHFSEQEYTEKGERKHIPMGSGEPKFQPLIELFVENGYSGTFICESPLLEKDALKMKEMYEKLI